MMGYGEAINLFFRRYVDFNGRSGRAEYWWPMLTIIGLTIVLLISTVVLTESFTEFGGAAIVSIALLVILMLVTFIPSISLSVRRLHDFNQTGWIYFGVVVVGTVVGLVQFIGMIVIGAIEGTKGPNKYGDDPLQPAESIATTFD